MLTTTLLLLSILQDPPATIDWHDDLERARALAFAEDRPLLAVFRCEP